jgi:RND family efflux transporter MFP subunit
VRQLFAQGAVSAQQADAAAAAQRDGDAAVDAARAQLAAATQQASLVDAGPRSEDRAAAQAQWQAAAATAQLARVTLAKTELVAPANAIVQRRDIEPGDLAQPGSEAFVLEDSGIPDVVVSVPERYAGQIHIGDHATITYRGSTYRAAIYRVEPAADAVTRTLEVRVRGARLPLPLGGIVEVALGEASSRGASIPLGALIVDASTGRRVVEIYDASHHTVAMRDVRLISTQGDAAIVAGLQAGEPIVVAGEYEAKPGVAVHVVGEGTNR